MEKGILKGILLTLGILSLFGVVFAVGFHSANEIVSGNFLGNYSFSGKVDFTNASIVGNGSSSMSTDWPDAIKCTESAGGSTRILYYAYNSSSSNEIGYRQINTVDIKLTYNYDGSYSTHLGMSGYDCIGMSIQELYDAGQAFNLVGGFDSHKISCPSGFTSIESNGHQLGCMQNDEEGTATYYSASNNCWQKYGAKLPTIEQWYLSSQNYNLNNEVDDWEYTIEIYQNAASSFKVFVVGSGSVNAISGTSFTDSMAYRCFIPN